MSRLPISPFDPGRYIGTVAQVTPTTATINLPRAYGSGVQYAGHLVARGQVGEFVVVEGDEHAVLGRIIEVRLPERDRLMVEPLAQISGNREPHAVGVIQLLVTISLVSGEVANSIPSYPRVGQHVFAAHANIVQFAAQGGSAPEDREVQLANLPHSITTTISFSPDQLFGRHCAVVGTTGGGKSWTVARMVEEIARLRGKAILFDATGEYRSLDERTRHVYLGGKRRDEEDQRQFVSFHFRALTELDLFVLFQPSSGTQAPKLREALRSLKLLRLRPDLASPNGTLVKSEQEIAPIESAFAECADVLNKESRDYDIARLAMQINEECFWPTMRGNSARYGQAQENERGYCASLVSRIASTVNSEYMACLFRPEELPSLGQVVKEFMAADDQSILRVSMEELPFEHHARELVTNAMGRYFLNQARKQEFRKKPMVVILDEAHQFLNRSIGDELNRVMLESFGLIAKEGRKYGLTCVLATQRPRDVPEDVLSQMGMFIVHRLIGERDRAVVEKACGNMDASAARFLPTLGQGEAIVVGIDSPMPLPVKIIAPQCAPETKGPDYAGGWI